MVSNQRLMRALNDPNMSVCIKKEDDDYKLFQVVGSNNDVYDVMISTSTCTCTCPDFLYNNTRCKHQLLCIINSVNTEMNSDLLKLGALKIEDLNKYDCSICQQNINGAYYKCPTCSNMFDVQCIYNWSQSCKKRRTNESCPICRSLLQRTCFT